jgi:hypothetical protein
LQQKFEKKVKNRIPPLFAQKVSFWLLETKIGFSAVFKRFFEGYSRSGIEKLLPVAVASILIMV